MSNVREMFPNTPDNKKEQKPYSYDEYKNLKGIINEQDYNSALARLKNTTTFDETQKAQAVGIARIAGIESAITEDVIKLYVILRGDDRPEGVKHHHDEMGDEHIFAEALRMVGDEDSLHKLIEKYHEVNPGMSFEYNQEGDEKLKKAA